MFFPAFTLKRHITKLRIPPVFATRIQTYRVYAEKTEYHYLLQVFLFPEHVIDTTTVDLKQRGKINEKVLLEMMLLPSS